MIYKSHYYYHCCCFFQFLQTNSLQQPSNATWYLQRCYGPASQIIAEGPKSSTGRERRSWDKSSSFFQGIKMRRNKNNLFQPFVFSCGSSNHWRFELPVFWLTLMSTFCLQTVDWDLLSQKKIAAPFKPRIGDELDVSNFAEEFTDMVPTYSPAAVPKTADRIFKVRWTQHFKVLNF